MQLKTLHKVFCEQYNNYQSLLDDDTVGLAIRKDYSEYFIIPTHDDEESGEEELDCNYSLFIDVMDKIIPQYATPLIDFDVLNVTVQYDCEYNFWFILECKPWYKCHNTTIQNAVKLKVHHTDVHLQKVIEQFTSFYKTIDTFFEEIANDKLFTNFVDL